MQVTNEMELIVLFVQESASIPDIEIISITGSSFPDAIIKWGGVEYRVEFEYRASNFWTHRHNPVDCDLIICWENNLPVEVLPTISLQDEDWQNSEIVLVNDIEKTALYWKRRALSAEDGILRFRGQSPPTLQITDDDRRKITDDDRRKMAEMHQEGKSFREISQAVWGADKFGGYYNDMIRAIVARQAFFQD